MDLVRLIKICLNETYSRVCIGKHLSEHIPLENGPKQGDALSLLLFSFPLGYAIRKVKEFQGGLKLNATNQLLTYADEVNPLGDNIGTMKKNTETSIDANGEVGLEIIIVKTKYILLSCHHNAGPNHDIKTANRPYEKWQSSNIWE
jgi:hypothetical protein